jgi:N-acetyl-anhydromuramyl-L-alanine amidase AmpD
MQGGVLRDGRRATADYLIVRNGAIYKITPHGHAAYHAGICVWEGKLDTTNVTSAKLVGIELENHDGGGEVPTSAQHYALAALLLDLAHVWKWSPMRVYGHGNLASPIGRRNDPRGLDYGLVFWLMQFTPNVLTLAHA